MNKVKLLHQRLQEIANSLKQGPHGLALMGLGSTGAEISRMDVWSDLDFFAIVARGHKQDFIADLNWLERVHKIAWCFKNTEDGYKLLFADGVFCEFAVFEPEELSHIPYIAGQFIWRDTAVAESLVQSKMPPGEPPDDREFLIGELLTNLYVGLCRFRRGEIISAMRFIQIYAVDRLITLLDLDTGNINAEFKDAFCPDRRVELRHPRYQELLLASTQGAERCCQSAQTILAFVESHYLAGKSEYRSLLVEIKQLL